MGILKRLFGGKTKETSSRDAEILEPSLSSDETFLNSMDKTEYKNALKQIDDQSVLNELLESVQEREKIVLVLRKIKNKSIIEKYAQEHPDNGIRITAIKKLKNPDLLAQIALYDDCNGVRMAATANISNTEVLEQISQNDSHSGVREAAIKVLEKNQKFKKAASSTETEPVAKIARRADADLSSGKMQKHNFNSTKYSGEWTTFASDLAMKIGTGEVTTKELCLYCKDLSAAQALAGRYPDTISDILDGSPETVEFPDGSGAVRFFVKDGTQIPDVLSNLGQGDYGGVPLTIRGGICPGLPAEYWQSLRQMVGTDQALALGSTFTW